VNDRVSKDFGFGCAPQSSTEVPSYLSIGWIWALICRAVRIQTWPDEVTNLTISMFCFQILVDCSGGDEVSEESGFERKKDALIQIMGGGPKPVERARSDDDEEWKWGREKSAKDRREARRKSGKCSMSLRLCSSFLRKAQF
jgi:hypothetical protein